MVKEKQVIEAVEELNKSGLAKMKIEVANVEFADLKEAFLSAMETVDEKDYDKLPKVSGEINNKLIEEEESGVNNDVSTAVIEEKKKKVKKEKPEKNKEAKKEEPVKKVKVAKKEEKKVVAKKEKKNGKEKSSNETRPEILKRKIQEYGKKVTIEQLCEDEELLKNFDNHKSWIKNDFNKIKNAK